VQVRQPKLAAFLAAQPRPHSRLGSTLQPLQSLVDFWREPYSYRDRMGLLCGLGILLMKHFYEVRGLSVETLDCDPKARLD
jgi:hypothetical protein